MDTCSSALTSAGSTALGRRIKKHYRGQTTHFVWDGNVPLHEWVSGDLQALQDTGATPIWSADADIKRREAQLSEHLAQGPPQRGSESAPITWLFEPESFAPMARLQGGQAQSILTDHLGTPVLMVDSAGDKTWSAAISTWGELRNLEGNRLACPFRWPGQYEDAETGLYYNRFRYYDPDAGEYVSQDPIGLDGGSALCSYVADSCNWTAPFRPAGSFPSGILPRVHF